MCHFSPSPWHRGALNLPVNVPPDSGHILHGESTGGTGVQPLLEHVSVARGVEEVRTRGNVGSIPTAVDILTKRKHIITDDHHGKPPLITNSDRRELLNIS